MKRFKILCLLTPFIVGILGLLFSYLIYGNTPGSYSYHDGGTEVFTPMSFNEMLSDYWRPVVCLFTCYLNLIKRIRESIWLSLLSFFWPLVVGVILFPLLFVILFWGQLYTFYLVLIIYYPFFRIKGLSWISEEKELAEWSDS